MKGLGWLLAFFIALIAVGAFTLGFSLEDAFGEHHGVCSSDVTSIEGSDDSVTYNAGTDVVDGMCLKAGNTQQHTFFDVDANTGCYAINGIGTSVVIVTRLGEGSECQGISHIDVMLRPQETPTPIPTPTPRETPTPTPTNTPTTTPTSTPSPTSTPDATPTPTLTPAATSTFQAPVAFPNTGGEPAENECREWTTGQAGDVVHPCPDDGKDYLVVVSILLAVIGLAALAFWALFRRW
ncbi:hypothetical protein LCGC14_3056220 [marine sediment metagenome]|uniref:Uncharacterized protein n=1 Tax=marine sediment metagenome TaxID=412755 RepID=A0A0F8YT20_9ZZZZ